MSLPDLFAAPDWQMTFIALMTISLITLVWVYVRCRAALWVRFSCGLLKAAGIFLLALFLLEPMQSTEVPRPGANLFLVLADASQSLQIRDAGQGVSREERLRQKLTEDTAWLKTLEKSFELRKFTFARQLKSSQFDSYQATGIGSSLIGSLDAVRRRYRGRPVAGIVVLTDGIATDAGTGGLPDWTGLPPVYPVVAGQDRPELDIGISGFSVSQTNFEAAPVHVSAELFAEGLQGKDIRAELVDEAGAVVAEQTVQDTGSQGMAALHFKVRPEKPGVNVYRLRVAEPSQFVAFDDPEAASEATMINNERTILVDRGRGPYRILYVSGRPNWEFKFLRRALLEDDEIDLVGLIRIAREEPKFTFRSRRDETTNPLFRGFGNERDEDAERYDEPVIVRLGTRDADELRDGFPRSAEELFQYHALVLDDVEAGFFTEDQKSLIKEFVSSRGGGFLMLGGQESFFEGRYDRTPVGDLLPVYVDRRETVRNDSRFRLQLTREGWLQPWVRMEATEQEETARLENMPMFATVNPIRLIKPGASVLARVENPAGESLNALVAHKMGKGRAAALLIGDFWRWHLRHKDRNDDLLKAWRQMMRWLVADVPRRVDVEIKKQADANLSVQLRIAVNDKTWQPLDNATVVAVVTRPDGTTVELQARPLDESAGLFGVTYVPRESGAYRVQVTARASDGSSIGKRESGWVSEPASEEFEQLKPNRELLENIAAQTGGQVIELDGLEKLSRQLPAKNAPVMETRLKPWWHRLPLFLLALGLLIGEWGLRRWKGLP